MKVLVTGGCGFIGSNLVDRLVEEGHEVEVIDNLSSDAHEQFYYNDGASYLQGDICDRSPDEFEGIDVIFHLAAEARIQPAILNPKLATRSNVIGTLNMLEIARAHGAKFIYSSTSSYYGLANPIPNKENMHRDCLNPYSVTKVCGEDLCKMYHSLYGVKTIMFRYFNVYGERQPTKGQYAPVIGLFQRQMADGKKMTIVGDGEQRRDFTHVSDVVDANIHMATLEEVMPEYKDYYGQVFNVGTGTNNSVLEIAEMLGGGYEFIPERPGEARETLADNRKLLSKGWSPKVRLEDWIKK